MIELSKILKQIVNKHGSKHVIRNRKTSALDGLLFYLLHSQNGCSMDSAAASLNDFNKRYLKRDHVSRQSFASRANSLPESFFEDVCYDVCHTIDKMYYTKNITDTYDICAVDGCDTNNSKNLIKDGFKANKNGDTVTALNIGIYNVTRNYPIAIEMVTHKNERKAFIDCMNNQKFFSEISNKSIFVFDRGFDGAAFFEKHELLGLNYVCRLKCNSNFILPMVTDCMRPFETYQTRIVTYKIGEHVYYLATNLFDTKEFTINKLKQIYHERWTIEESFKYMKSNFDFGSSELESAVAIRKSIYCHIITMKLVNLLAEINKRDDVKANRIINKKTLTDGMYRGFLYLLINGMVSRSRIKDFRNNYIILESTK